MAEGVGDDGLVESLQAAVTAATNRLKIVLPRAAAIRLDFTAPTFGVVTTTVLLSFLTTREWGDTLFASSRAEPRSPATPNDRSLRHSYHQNHDR
jgi:hypothetical protein